MNNRERLLRAYIAEPLDPAGLEDARKHVSESFERYELDYVIFHRTDGNVYILDWLDMGKVYEALLGFTGPTLPIPCSMRRLTDKGKETVYAYHFNENDCRRMRWNLLSEMPIFWADEFAEYMAGAKWCWFLCDQNFSEKAGDETQEDP